ncbi:HAMP domain-containing histidine kinase [Dysosmobacter sp. NSJ-60]|uniref:histidine kinase n=3 Tax=Pusillibacter faecalis TaxID=2714358 RepID=A0A810QFA8_9FIRM|nr:HAMP domain-containing sensor histidine kinase [Pusillibacter faecalis]MBC5748440.1 HAMP domain-containing histidine kinase [Dysosmobacter hominis]MBS5658608.1 HAMP domain-containing histidine kinase [Oscillibacter sp.]MCQ5027395.1 HAMP domain-containing histidine kinase [Oscillibacter valericigenes]BCK84546.1 two-component sensor histidine kinase [Pusillibacter faecalis]
MKRLKRQFQGLYWRQLYVTAGTVMLTLLLLGASFFALSYNYARNQRSDEIIAQAKVMSQLSVSYLETGRYLTMEELRSDPGFQQLASFAAMVSDVDFMICDEEGHVLLSTDETLDGRVLTMPADMTRSIMEEGSSSRRDDLDGLYQSKRFVVGVPAVNSETLAVVGEVFAVATMTSLDTMWRGFVGLFFMTSFVSLMIAFMSASIAAMRQVKPIREMAQATRLYAEGDFDVRMRDYGRNDEVGELAASFNNMAESLQQTERQRREFIANISHELKTPMTTIAGYTDGILDGTIPPENERRYLQIISNESRRLSRMVRRMLDVSQLQAIDPLRGGNHFDICESMRRVLISMEQKINDRHLDVDADIPEEPILVLGDNDMITQVIYNLLENATKFAREGTALYLGITAIDGKARVTVRNLGDTIPADELPLLFERFHKSDKSRSEDKDGVGLGLYIVKTILEQHKEKINVTSEDGVTTFTFSLAME